jgi:hypothetical protein
MTIQELCLRDYPALKVLWSGALPDVGKALIVEDPGTGRCYTYPGLKAWRQPLPGATPPKAKKKEKLVQREMFA